MNLVQRVRAIMPVTLEQDERMVTQIHHWKLEIVAGRATLLLTTPLPSSDAKGIAHSDANHGAHAYRQLVWGSHEERRYLL